jgi:PAS domain-containing protein
LSDVGPTDLVQTEAANGDRRDYETFLRAHDRIVRRARGVDGRDATEGERQISWWLFHQWADHRRVSADAVLHAAATDGDAGDDLWAVLERESLARLLACVDVSPHDLCGKGRGAFAWGDDYYPPLREHQHQAVRERLVGLVFAVAHARAVQLTALPFTVVKHLAIPDPVGLSRLADEVASLRWQPVARGDGMQLSVRCHHPAVADALTEHCAEVDLLLRLARQTADLAQLPPYATADGVWEVDGNGCRVSAGAAVRFRLDEERVQELLMGESLYQDRALAIREMYQNALDACRYRRAREELNAQQYNRACNQGSWGYLGRIEFEQGTDE